MAKITKGGVHFLGGLFTIGAIAGTAYFGVMPNVEEAQNFEEQRNSIGETVVSHNATLDNLQEWEENSSELYYELSTMQNQIPSGVDVSSIQRSVVNSMNDEIGLISFTYGATGSFTIPEAPSVSLEEPEDPFQIGDSEGSSGDGSDGSGGESGSSGESSGLSATPVVIEIDADSVEGLATFLNDMESASRMLLVVKSSISYTEEGLTATIHLYGFSR